MPEAVPELQGQLLGDCSQNLPNESFGIVKGPQANLSPLRGHLFTCSGLTPRHPAIWFPRVPGTGVGIARNSPRATGATCGRSCPVRGFWPHPEAWTLASSGGPGGTLQSTRSTGDNLTSPGLSGYRQSPEPGSSSTKVAAVGGTSKACQGCHACTSDSSHNALPCPGSDRQTKGPSPTSREPPVPARPPPAAARAVLPQPAASETKAAN